MQRTRNRPTVDGHPVLQWHNGKTTAKAADSKRFAEGFVGFTVEADRWEAFDALAAELNIASVEIKHRRPGGFEVKRHWSLGDALNVYPLTAGPVRTSMLGAAKLPRESAERAGLVARWRDDRTHLSLWVLPVIAELVHAAPLVLSVRARMTDHLYGALLDHCTRVCDAAEGLTGRAVMPWDLALPLVAGAEQDFGKAEQTTVTPLASGHGPTLTNDDVAALALPESLVDVAAALAEDAVAWAIAEATAEPEQTETAPAAPAEEVPF